MSTIQNPATNGKFMLVDTQAPRKPLPVIVRAAEGENRLVFISDPGGVAAEQYRIMRRKLVERYPMGGAVLMTSPGSGDGKTLTSTNLAWCMAETGVPTLLAEMDLRNPSVSRLLGYQCESSGIESVLGGGEDPENIIRQVNRMRFHVAAAGRITPNPVDLLAGRQIREFLAWARQNYKWIVVDSPPLFPLSDALELTSMTDFTVLVVRAHVSPRVLVEKAIEMLGPHLQQVIMNEGTECADSSYRYASAYYPYGQRKK
ncbi:MAG: CpsD/CapB family tyrosine-protein kinase [Acidobacteriia bacterium]|nr:CpsD/CapB family tyrosine-protein kinase [Terriglobia bacterium]